MRCLAYIPLLCVALAGPSAAKNNGTQANLERANAVKNMFRIGWDGYYQYAFPKDQLQPVTNTGYNPRNGWGATAVDGLDTAIIMGFGDIVNTVLNFIPKIDYTVSDQNSSVSVFETTIRYLGGMMSAYDLLNGPYADLKKNNSLQVKALLDQSVRLAGVLEFTFNTTTGIPNNIIYINNGTFANNDATADLAEAGSLILEWQRLSDLTGDAHYAQLANKAEQYLLNPKPASAEPFPGLVGTDINITTGLFVDNAGGWQGGDDSFYEYLIKMYVYNAEIYGTYKDRWVLAVESTIANLTSHPEPRPDLTFTSEYDGTQLVDDFEELGCFNGGNFILGGLVLKEQRYVDYGIALTESCHALYTATVTGIGPEIFSWNASNVPANQAEFFQKNGYYVEDPSYILRPEYLESLYYAYRATGNTTYQDWSWDTIVAINATTRVGSGYSDIQDVTVVGGGGFLNDQESFLFAEALKYAYLIQADDSPVQVNNDGQEKWVFNTEAHPFKVKGTIL